MTEAPATDHLVWIFWVCEEMPNKSSIFKGFRRKGFASQLKTNGTGKIYKSFIIMLVWYVVFKLVLFVWGAGAS